MRGDLLYRLLARTLDMTVWGGELVGAEHLPESGAAVYVANHAAALGPIAVTASMSVRLHPWAIADMLDWEGAAPYLKKDFIEPVFHLPAWLSATVARMLAQVTVRLLRHIGCIPAWNDKNVLETYQLSEEYLASGRSILVFPEDPTQPADGLSGMRPFKTGFARLGQIHFAHTQQRLRFYPVAVLLADRQVRLGEAIEFNQLNRAVEERLRLARLLESTIQAMVVGDRAEVHAGAALPR